MEDVTGDRDDVSADPAPQDVPRRRACPRLFMISSCHAAEQRADLPSLLHL